LNVQTRYWTLFDFAAEYSIGGIRVLDGNDLIIRTYGREKDAQGQDKLKINLHGVSIR
jgi:hypothetical protein